MVSVGDKFIVEIDSVIDTEHGKLYRAKGFNSLVFDDNGIERLEEYHGNGEVYDDGEKDGMRRMLYYIASIISDIEVEMG